MIEQLFEVATEFRFDVGQAVFNTQALTDSVDQLSKTTNSALSGLNFLASSLVSHLGLGSGGLLSVFTKAIQLAQEFDTSALMFSNTLSTNMNVLKGDIGDFNGQLATSKMLLGKINEASVKFGIDHSQLMLLTNKLAGPMAQAGLLGTNFEGAIKMAKNLTLASETMGLHPQVASESLYRALTFHMPLHGALFSRLANTPAFKDSRIVTQQQLMNVPDKKKFEIISNALQSLAGNAEALAFRAQSLNVQFIIMKNYIANLLRPLGEALKGTIVKLLQQMNIWLKENAAGIGDALGRIFKSLLNDPRGLLVTFLQLRHAGSDFHKALKAMEIYTTVRYLKDIAKWLGFNGDLLATFAGMLWNTTKAIAGIIPFAAIFSRVASFLSLLATDFLFPLLMFWGAFQIISRAKAKAFVDDKLEEAKLTKKIVPLYEQLKNTFSNLFRPITNMVEVLSDWLEPLFKTSTYMKIGIFLLGVLNDFFSILGETVLGLSAAIVGLETVFLNWWANIANLKAPWANAGAAYKFGYHSYLDQYQQQMAKKKEVSSVVNNNYITARFDMREQLEPDRIAFAVTESLKKLAIGGTQAKGRSYDASTRGDLLNFVHPLGGS